MKSLSMFNKPATKVDNKQSGVIFLQWAILVFIAGFAMICVVWWFYYILQDLIIKVKLEIEQMQQAFEANGVCRIPNPEQWVGPQTQT